MRNPKRAMLDTGQWCCLHVKAWVVFVKCYDNDRTAQWRKSTMEPMALHLLHCTISALSATLIFCEIRRYDRTAQWRKSTMEPMALHLLHTALTATLISRSAAAAAGDQVLILLKVTTATISPAVSQHGQRGSNREKFLWLKWSTGCSHWWFYILRLWCDVKTRVNNSLPRDFT